ncbi:MAG: CbiX/SirB N-terminal domain-containing protein [Myxococcota bacterium]
MPESGIVLLAHGSPDPDWLASARRTESALAARSPDTTVRLATLGGEHQTDCDTIVDALVHEGHRRITVVALFLSAGGKHVKRDLPARVATMQARHGGVQIRLAPGALGEAPEVIEALAAAAARAAGESEP